MSPLFTAAAVMLAGSVAGCLGALLGIGGGVFLVPFLNLVIGLPWPYAAGIGLTTVIATSSAVSARTAGNQLINLRLGMVLEIATTAGGLSGALVEAVLSERVRDGLFALVAAAIAVIMLGRVNRRNVIFRPDEEPGLLGGRFYDAEGGSHVIYRVRRLPVGMAMSFLAGVVSSTLGIGGGILKVPALNAWCGVPLRAAAATSALMIGVTAVAAAPIYYAGGKIEPHYAAASILGVLVGSTAGFWIGARANSRALKLLMAGVLGLVAAIYFAKAWM